jgi:hypothetical protein
MNSIVLLAGKTKELLVASRGLLVLSLLSRELGLLEWLYVKREKISDVTHVV